MGKPNDVQECSGNFFADLGVSDSEGVLAKGGLARHSTKFIKRQGLTQIELTKLLGLDQPKVSALMQGRLVSFATAEGHQDSEPFTSPRNSVRLTGINRGGCQHGSQCH